ncbi:MAG: AbiEi antitoxin N-terminal domain-containing protein, partial [Chitinispirillaceae bacterium]|nr:AbiEi antitoxin N-terminal domain-containing protein [Chitinispirillaceae bacterium]
MGRVKQKKINRLFRMWPRGTVATSPWLNRQGIGSDLASRYRKSGWVEPVGHGAFQLAGDTVSWCGALYSLQTQLGLSTHVAGKSALALLGKAHYVP